MRKFGLIGYPLTHSFSVTYFSEKFRRENIADAVYENFPIKSIEEFPALLEKNPDLSGLNVTIPYKTKILKYVDITGDEVDRIGAANVIKIKWLKDRPYISAYNSDVTGIKDSLVPCTRGTASKVMILGTGGSSKAVVWTLKKMGCETILISRRSRPGILTYKEITPEILETVDIIVNTTPVGMYPDTGAKPDIDYGCLSQKHILFDLVYNPEMTEFLKSGKERGCTIITGMKMLRSQAERSWDIWNDDSL
ncbi:MAG TPA: shikimate dehydrogenase [Bacteroidales bacterium]|nr:shikimate dehydrogenase [Bacteroidales bacterium]HPF04024.1 shikimate dehydrogenase [Bacteroidales bacterium]HPJ59538.1 shikimate dehydrogenase [Bacteroidales bacterium]HPR12075.1 shikimate dehydrogenase [Bacteroidales bacterium]HRW86195.1 shikimate dehydrogenase [Bacteroidales bacterium]